MATGRGEIVEPLAPFPTMKGAAFFLVHPGFGISTPWAYQQLARFPEALNGRPGRAQALTKVLREGSLREAGSELYNALEAPALEKFPILSLYQEFLRERGALAALMSGSGSTTFAIFANLQTAEEAIPDFQRQFGDQGWIRAVPV
jgi:4-diphosphocytidyl-2-C-methyl-D-erythritol kinase